MRSLTYTRLRFIAAILLSWVLVPVFAQDLTGTWKGDLVKDNTFREVDRAYKMTWEIVQVEREVYGIVYFFPQDTKEGDQANAWYTWYGKQTKKQPFPFAFIQGRYIEGLGTSPVYQFNVRIDSTAEGEVLVGKWFTQLEALNTLERSMGVFRMQKVSGRVSDKLWLKRKEKAILEKLEKQEGN